MHQQLQIMDLNFKTLHEELTLGPPWTMIEQVDIMFSVLDSL